MKKHLVLKLLRDWINVVRGSYLVTRKKNYISLRTTNHESRITKSNPIAQRKLARKLSVALIMLTVFCGCSKKSPLPKDMASMAQIYDEHFQEVRIKRMELKDARERISRPLKNHGIDLDGYTRDAHNEIQSIFPELPNPTLVMYLFPHLGENGAPIPGYSTTFTMYDKTQYALPGEVGGE